MMSGPQGCCPQPTVSRADEIKIKLDDEVARGLTPDTYRRLKALACRYWAIPPYELDDAVMNDRIPLTDIMDLVTLLAHDPSINTWLARYLVPEVVERKAADQRSQMHLSQMKLWLSKVQRTPENEEKWLVAQHVLGQVGND